MLSVTGQSDEVGPAQSLSGAVVLPLADLGAVTQVCCCTRLRRGRVARQEEGRHDIPLFSQLLSTSVKYHLIMANGWVNLVLILYTEGKFHPYAIDLHGSNISFKLRFHITESLLVSFKKYSYFFPSYECFFLLLFHGC